MNTQITRTAMGLLNTKRSQRGGSNPGIRLGIFLVVIGVEAVPLQESPPLPRRLRRRCALRSRGRGHRETASGEAQGDALVVRGGERREEWGGGESGGRGSHWRRPVENPKRFAGRRARRGIRGGFALSVASGILSRPIEIWTAWRGQLKYSGSFLFLL
jgi:hypothetical protein